MEKIRAAIVGYGNIGKYVLEALLVAPDFEVAGIVRRNAQDIPEELKDFEVVSDIRKLNKVDVAIPVSYTHLLASAMFHQKGKVNARFSILKIPLQLLEINPVPKSFSLLRLSEIYRIIVFL